MSYDLMFKQANDLYLSGALQQAEQLYRQILETAPENADVLNMLGLVAQARGLHREAAVFFGRALVSAPNHLPLHFNLAVSLGAAGKYIEAAESYRQVLRLNPKLKEAWNNLGGLYEKLGSPAQAEESYRQALALDQSYEEAAVNLAVLLDDTETLKNLAQTSPNPALPLYYLALKSLQQKDFNQARQYAEQAEKNGSPAPDICLLKGIACLELDDKNAAVQAFRRTLALDETCVPAMINLGRLENDENLLKQALDLEPDNFEAHMNYAACLHRQQRLLEALEEYRKAAILNPDVPELSNNLGLVLKDSGDYEQALGLFLNALSQKPDSKDFSINMAETLQLLQQTQPQKASAIALNWKKMFPHNVFAAYICDAFAGRASASALSYCEQMFDTFAAHYEQTMETLNYGVWQKIKESGISLKGNILDLGCGTGLAAAALKTADNTFTGVDISAGMLAKAREKRVYAHLEKADIAAYLADTPLTADWVLALDVFNYIGDISPVLSKLTPRRLLFTVENAPAEIQSCRLMPNGRYQHNPGYVRDILQNCGYKKINMIALELRRENGCPVAGTLFHAET